MDDLESFLYAFSTVVIIFLAPGVINEEENVRFVKWEAHRNTQRETWESKMGFMFRRGFEKLGKFWGSACDKLLKDFHAVVREIAHQKDAISIIEDSDEVKLARLAALGRNVEEHYTSILDAFDEALETIQREDGHQPYLPPVPIDGDVAIQLQRPDPRAISRPTSGGVLVLPDVSQNSGTSSTHRERPDTARNGSKRPLSPDLENDGNSHKRRRDQMVIAEGSGTAGRSGRFEEFELRFDDIQVEEVSGSTETDDEDEDDDDEDKKQWEDLNVVWADEVVGEDDESEDEEG